jgi:hypothetical protein
VSKWAKRILFTVTGYFMYYPAAWVFSLFMERVCVPFGDGSHFCTGVFLVMVVIAIVGLATGMVFREWHRCGKWLWLLIVPAWRTP